MRRVLGSIGIVAIAVPLIALAVLWPLLIRPSATTAAVPPDDPVVITDYRAEYHVDEHGTLEATEIVSARFPEGRHGIFRYWDITNPNDPGLRQPPEVTSVRMDGRAVPHEMLWRSAGRVRVARIGDPLRTLSEGPHVFDIRYRIDGVLDPAGTGADLTFPSATGDPDAAPSVFLWNVVPGGWENRIERAEVTMHLPGTVPGAQCVVGWDHGSACASVTVDGETVTVSAADLPPRTPVTVRAGVDVPVPSRTVLPWSLPWDRVLGSSVPALTVVVLVTVLAAGLGTWLRRWAVESPPPFPLQYAPPDGVGPVHSVYIRTEEIPPTALSATLFHLAETGLIAMSRGLTTWTLTNTATKEQWAETGRENLVVARALGLTDKDATFTADGSSAAGRRFALARAELHTAVRNWALREGLMTDRSGMGVWRALNVVSGVCAVLAAFRLGFPATAWVVPFVVFCLITLPVHRRTTAVVRTREGREIWSRAGGFHRMLVTDSAEARFDFAARRDLYLRYLPYAIAAGAADAWAAKYHAETGEEPPLPGTPRPERVSSPSPSSHHTRPMAGQRREPRALVAAEVASFDAAVDTSITAFVATQNALPGQSSHGGWNFTGGGSRGGWSSGGSSSRSSGRGSGGRGGSRGGGGRGGGGGGGGSW